MRLKKWEKEFSSSATKCVVMHAGMSSNGLQLQGIAICNVVKESWKKSALIFSIRHPTVIA
jgi:hypothetical protein